MPKKGYKSVTIKETVMEKLVSIAKKTDKSIPEIIAQATDRYMEQLEKGEPING